MENNIEPDYFTEKLIDCFLTGTVPIYLGPKQVENYFDPNGWCEASVHLPSIIYKNLSKQDKRNIKILEKEAFYVPSYTNVHKIFEGDRTINNSLLTLHFWNTYSEKYYEEINGFDWALNNRSLYAKLMNNLIKLMEK